MALRLGIGDTLTLCKGAIDLCSTRLHDEPEDSRRMIADMCLMRSHLQSLSKKMGDERDFVASRPDIAPAIQRSLAPIHRDLTEMRQMLHERNARRKPSLHIVDQVRAHVLYKAKLGGFREKMPVHRKSINEMETLIDAQTHSDRRASIARLGSLVEEHEEGKGRQEEAEKWTNELLERFGERMQGPDSVSPDEALLHIEWESVKSGGDQEMVREKMKPIRNALAIHSDPEGREDGRAPERLQLERFKF